VNDGPFLVGTTGDDLMSNDRGGADTMIVVSLPGHGKLFGDNGEQLAVGSTFTTWSYTANNDNADEDWHGAETWEYKLKESCEDDTTQESNSATVTINVPEVDMVIYHGQGGAAVDKTKERVTDQLDANGNPDPGLAADGKVRFSLDLDPNFTGTLNLLPTQTSANSFDLTALTLPPTSPSSPETPSTPETPPVNVPTTQVPEPSSIAIWLVGISFGTARAIRYRNRRPGAIAS